MDAVRFLNFLQSFAASTSSRLATQPASGGLESTLSDFEAQLRTLLDQNSSGGGAAAASPALASDAGALLPAQTSTAADMPTAAQVLGRSGSTLERQVFVTGGGSESPVSQGTPQTTFQTAAPAGADVAAPQAPADPEAGKAPLSALQKIVAWQREQIHPMLNVRVGDLWDRQGIADPLNNPGLLGHAQQIHDRANNFRSLMPGYVAAWEGEWQAPAAPVQMATRTPDASGFVTGGQG